MGLIHKIFTTKEEPVPTTEPAVVEEYTINNEIDSIISILENLGLLDVHEIYERITNKKTFDINMLTRLKIKPPTDIPYLEKYFAKSKLSYGSVKLKEVSSKIKEFAATKQLEGINQETILTEVLTLAKIEIDKYEEILIRFNETLRQGEEKAQNYVDIATMVENVTNYYKEQELGYPIQLDRKVTELSQELQNLPYGGYGELEIKKFETAARKMVEEGKICKEDTVHTLNRITTDLFNPRKHRYLSDVETLKKKLQMIDESPYISEFEKEQNKKKTIKEFNIMNGHKQDINSQVELLEKNLTMLEEGGYGEEVIETFNKRARTIVEDGKRIEKPEVEVQKEVQLEYQKLVDAYQRRLAEVRIELDKIDKDYLPAEEKKQKKNIIMEEFHDEMGLPIDYKDRINSMIMELKSLDHGGYGELKTKEFKNRALEELKVSKTRSEIRDALREIRRVQERMMKEYQEDLRHLEFSINKVNQDRHLKDHEKSEAIDELDREFKFKVGYRMNFAKYIENRAKDLRRIGERGYGEEAIDEFTIEAREIAQSSREEIEKYEMIKQKFNAFKKHYENNERTFAEWKRIQLKEKSDADQGRLEQKLNRKINHMLSLSPRALQEYFLEDDRKKKEKVEHHNYVAAFKFLAKKEAKYRRDESIYEKRLHELEIGETPYSQREIEDAAAELEFLSITNDELQKEDRIISVVEYVDSTLLKQMIYAEVSLMKAESTQ